MEADRKRKSVADAVRVFLGQCDVEPSTSKKYTRILDFFAEFGSSHGLTFMDEWDLDALDNYRLSRPLNALSWQKELQLLRTFFDFCLDRDWVERNFAKRLRMPSDPKPKPREPYSKNDIIRILSACETFGKYPYERLRAKAMVLLMRFYALRVSDVATLRRDRIKGDQIFVHALKNGATIWLPLYQEVKDALDRVPLPRAATADECQYFFWSGLGSRDEHVKTVIRTLKAVFKASGVKDAHAHRFRHTLATQILVAGGTIEDAANILGDSSQIIRKHYAKWSSEYQRRTIDIMGRVHGTYTAREKNAPITPLIARDAMVPGVGLEPTLPLPEKGF